MIITDVEITDFMPFKGTYHCSFEDNSIIGVIAEYEGEPERSNRGGKTSFIDALFWCLTGKSRAKREVELIHTGAECCTVSVRLLGDDGKHHTITRTRTAKNEGLLELGGQEGEKKRVAQEAIDALVGMNYEEFLNTAFFKQNDIDQFMRATQQEKKEILMRWLQQTAWPEYEARGAQHVSRLTKERDQLRASLEALPEAFDKDAMLARKQELDAQATAAEAEMKQLLKDRTQIELHIAKLSDVEKVKEKGADLLRRADRLRRDRPDSSQYALRMKQLEDSLAKYPKVSEEDAEDYREKKAKATRLETEWALKARQLREQKRTSTETMTGMCPIIKQSCDRIKMTKEYTAKLDADLARADAEKAKCAEYAVKVEKWLRLYDQRRQWEEEKARLVEKSLMVRQIEDQIAAVEREYDELMAGVPEDVDGELVSLRTRLKESRQRGTELGALLQETARQQGELAEAFRTGKAAQERRAELQEQIAQLEEQLGDALYVAHMFGKNGIPSIELENSFEEIEAEANQVLRALAAPFTFEFQATRELTDWEANCLACGHVYERGTRKHECPACKVPRQKKRRDELSLRVLEAGTERAFYLDSGGGQVLLSVAMRLALARLQQRRTGSNWSVLFLDEVFASLDPVNRRAMANLVSTALRGVLGFRQVFIISHTQEVQSSMADILRIYRRKTGWSEIRCDNNLLH